MNFILNKPYKSILLSIPLILALSVVGGNRATDIVIHDTYYVIAIFHIGILLSFILGLIGFLYWLVRNKMLIKWMTGMHVIATVFCFVSFIIAGLIFGNMRPSEYDTFETSNTILSILFLIAVLSQFLFLINLIFSFIRNREIY